MALFSLDAPTTDTRKTVNIFDTSMTSHADTTVQTILPADTCLCETGQAHVSTTIIHVTSRPCREMSCQVVAKILCTDYPVVICSDTQYRNGTQSRDVGLPRLTPLRCWLAPSQQPHHHTSCFDIFSKGSCAIIRPFLLSLQLLNTKT
jgi:hypothetical protein